MGDFVFLIPSQFTTCKVLHKSFERDFWLAHSHFYKLVWEFCFFFLFCHCRMPKLWRLRKKKGTRRLKRAILRKLMSSTRRPWPSILTTSKLMPSFTATEPPSAPRWAFKPLHLPLELQQHLLLSNWQAVFAPWKSGCTCSAYLLGHSNFHTKTLC